ncbi:hypothetical protein Tcan_04610 [Toxocara canis]|uniref:Uncharacterized protein n=1 Tax=Toxocara canis TaxID=6265 RepID=A0A0B2W272_TOXCA|nr:hypothetical protein Tcan_04610 [Toxocara canis]
MMNNFSVHLHNCINNKFEFFVFSAPVHFFTSFLSLPLSSFCHFAFSNSSLQFLAASRVSGHCFAVPTKSTAMQARIWCIFQLCALIIADFLRSISQPISLLNNISAVSRSANYCYNQSPQLLAHFAMLSEEEHV